MSIRSTGTNTAGTGPGSSVPPVRHMTNDDKELEKMLLREEKDEQYAVKHALKDLKAAEKAGGKSHKATDKALHAIDKAHSAEHKAAKALSRATHKHDDTVASIATAERNLGIKQRHQTQLEEDLEKKKHSLDEMQKRKEQHDSVRNAKRAEMLGYGPTSGLLADNHSAV